jgi:hypothetical protein
VTAPAGPTLAEIRTWPATVDVATAASALGISRSWAYQLAKADGLPCRVIALGGKPRVITASLIAELERTA